MLYHVQGAIIINMAYVKIISIRRKFLLLPKKKGNSGNLEEGDYAIKQIGSILRQVHSEKIMMALLFFFSKILAQLTQTCGRGKNHRGDGRDCNFRSPQWLDHSGGTQR